MNTIVTHSRSFHIDEIFAIALLKTYIDDFKDAKIIRTRDEVEIKEYQKDSNVFVVDVGFVYDENNLNFDHHQKDFRETWDDGTPLSSCGLIWKYLRDKKYLHQHMNQDMMNIIEDSLIKKVDLHDNGIETFRDVFFLSMYNRNHHDDKVMNRQFFRALSAAIDYYHNLFAYIKNDIKFKKELEKTISKNNDSDVIVFKQNIKVMSDIADNTRYKMAIFPHSKGKWILKAVPKSSREMFKSRVLFPEKWRGFKNNKLKYIDGAENIDFVHSSGHYAIVSSELEVAKKLAKDIVLFNSTFN